MWQKLLQGLQRGITLFFFNVKLETMAIKFINAHLFLISFFPLIYTYSPTEEHELELDKEHREQVMEKDFDSLPAFKRVLISDRDRYLAYSLKKAAEPTPTGNSLTSHRGL